MPPPDCPLYAINRASGIPGLTRPAGTALRVLRDVPTGTFTEYAPPLRAAILKPRRFSGDRMGVSPGHFQPSGEFLYRPGALRSPNQKTCGGRAGSTRYPEKALHDPLLLRCFIPVGCGKGAVRLFEGHFHSRIAKRRHMTAFCCRIE